MSAKTQRAPPLRERATPATAHGLPPLQPRQPYQSSYVVSTGDSTMPIQRPPLPNAAADTAAPQPGLRPPQPHHRHERQQQKAEPSSSPSSSLWARVRREVSTWRRGTVSIHDVDVWLRFNVYIRRGFRHRRLRKREALGSLFLYFHNESVNIFSHLLAALLMLSLLLWPPYAPAGSSSSSGGGSGGSGGGVDAYGGGVSSSPLWSAAGEDGAWRQAASKGGSGGGGRQGAAASSALQTPSWLLRSLHGLNGDGKASTEPVDAAAGGDGGSSRAYVPPGGGASPRDALPVLADDVRGWAPSPASSSTSSRWWAPFSFLFSSPLSAPAAVDDAVPQPISVAARLAFSLCPLIWCLCLTFVFSCTYHTFMPCCRSRRGYQQLLQCDVMGVLLSIGGSAYTYLTCGMPCASATTVLTAAVLLAAATFLCLYLVILAPMWDVLSEGCAWVSSVLQGAAATVVGSVMEYAAGGPLPALPAQQSSAPRPPRERGARVTERTGGETSAVYQAVLQWVRLHRPSARGVDAATATAAAAEVRDAHDSPATAAAPPAEPVHVSAHQRAAIMGVYCLLHLGLYRCCVVPKSDAAHGGYTQGVSYHNWSYLWLFLGGAINAARFPEKIIFHCTRAAAQHSRQCAADEAARWCAEELTADRREAPPVASSSPWWRRVSVSKMVVTYGVSAGTLDYVGNSHNLWHICTMLSAFCNVLAVYYDCVEYDLVLCPQ